MEDFHYDANRDAERQGKRNKFWDLGIDLHVCAICGEDDPLCLVPDHHPGRRHDETTVLICTNCHLKRTCDQRAEPSISDNPRNMLEVIGRWLLAMAEYFELLRDRLRQFGHWLINRAKDGYGDDLSFE